MFKVFAAVIVFGLISGAQASEDRFKQKTFKSLKTKLWMEGLNFELGPVGGRIFPNIAKLQDTKGPQALPEELVIGMKKAGIKDLKLPR